MYEFGVGNKESHSIKKITDNLIQLKNKQRQPHSIRTLLNSKYLKLNRKVPGGLAKCQRIVEEAKTRVLCKGRAGKNKEKQRRAKVEQRFLLKRDHRRLKPADCHVTRSHNHVVLGIGGWCKNMLLGETRRRFDKGCSRNWSDFRRFNCHCGEVKSNQKWQYNYVGVGFPTLQSLYLNFQSSVLRDPILHLTVEVLLRLVL